MDTTHPNWFQFPAQVPDEVDGYRLIKLIGEGGMGLVYAAEQTDSVKRMVALKFLKYQGSQDILLDRFRLESQSLALLHHPHVAIIHDSAFTAAGQPYLVMELVEGEPLDAYCNRKCLTIQDRIRLVLQVCSGVIHAHQKGIIHRDLKPANLLVSEQSGEPTVKIIDFGIAKDVNPESESKGTPRTRQGEMLGTPFFISPEQANGEAVDTRTDIFSLGSILFQTLTNTYPFESQPQSYFQYLNRLLSEPTPRPSERLKENREIMGHLCKERQTSPDSLLQAIRSDLDWVVLKALKPDRSERYQSVSELKADLERYLEGHPVEARPNNNLYAIVKFAKRHKTSVILGLSAIFFLVTILAVSLFSLYKIRQSEREARKAQIRALSQSNKNRALNEFLVDMLSSPDPNKSGKDVRVLDLFNDYERKLSRLRGQDALQVSIRTTMGKTYLGLAEYDEALKNIEIAEELARKLAQNDQGLPDPDWADLLVTKSRILIKMARYTDAEKLLTDLLAELKTTQGEFAGRIPEGMLELGSALRLQGRTEEALAQFNEALQMSRLQFGPSHPLTMNIFYEMGETHWTMGHLGEAEAIFRETLEFYTSHFGLEHPRTLENMGNLANTFFRQGRFGACEDLHRKVYETRLSVLGPNHHATLFSLNNIGSVLYKQKRYSEAESFNRQAVEGFSQLLGVDHPDTLMAMNNLANVYRKQKDYGRAESLYKKAYLGQVKTLGNKHMETNRTRYNLIRVLQAQGKMAESLPFCDLGIKYMPNEPWGSYLKAKALAALGHRQEAVNLLGRMIDKNPDDSQAVVDFVALSCMLDQSERARAAISSILEQLGDGFYSEILKPLNKKAVTNYKLQQFLEENRWDEPL